MIKYIGNIYSIPKRKKIKKTAKNKKTIKNETKEDDKNFKVPQISTDNGKLISPTIQIHDKLKFEIEITEAPPKQQILNNFKFNDESLHPKNLEKNDEFVLEHYSINEAKDKDSSEKKKIIKLLNDAKEKKDALDISLWDFLIDNFKKACGVRNNEIERAQNEFLKDLDIITISKRLKELERLKLILFNQDQLIIFNSLAKPLLEVYEEVGDDELKSSVSIMSAMLKSSSLKNIDEKTFLNSYKRVKLKISEDDDMNKRLINLLNSQIQKI